MQAGNCCLNSTRLSFLLVNLSCLLTERDYRHVWLGFALQWYVISRPTPQCKQMILKLASIIYIKISSDYLETIWELVYTLCNFCAWGKCYKSCCREVAEPTFIPRFVTVLCFHLSHARWLGLALQLLIPLFCFSPLVTKCHVNIT